MSKLEYIICNTVPANFNAPVSSFLLGENATRVLKTVADSGVKTCIFLIDEKDINLINLIKNTADNFPGLKIEIKSVDATYGMVLQEHTAIIRVIEGEKPIPFKTAQNYPVYSCEALLTKGERKTVYIYGQSKDYFKHTFTAKVTPNEILEKAGGYNEKFKAMYLGWPLGQFIGKDELDKPIELINDFVFIADDKNCILELLEKYVIEFASQSCGKCVFCKEGTNQMKMILKDIGNKKGKSGDIDLLLDLCSQIKYQVLCTLGVAAANTVESAIIRFREEIENHITRKTCKATVCNKFVTFHILPDKCTGCQECVDKCEEDAISGTKNFIHIIDQDDCTQCGLCVDSCTEDAIIKAGAIKPKCPGKPVACGKWLG